jgi:hypothetical protein
VRMTRAAYRARQRVDDAHLLARRQDDPVTFLRQEQAETEAVYARSGDPDDLALVRAFEQSLDR